MVTFSQTLAVAFIGVMTASGGVTEAKPPALAPASPLAPPTARFIEAAPYINLQLDLKTVRAAIAGDMLAPNQTIATYIATPRVGVRILVASGARIGTFPQSVPANTLLFEVGFGDAKGFCAPIVAGQGVRESQCFIDVNNDNKFDASYIGYETWKGQTLYWGQVAYLASIPPAPYEASDVSSMIGEPMSFFLRRVRNKAGEFQMALGPRNNGVPVVRCVLDAVTPCRLGRHIYTLEASGGGVKVLSSALAGDQLDILTGS